MQVVDISDDLSGCLKIWFTPLCCENDAFSQLPLADPWKLSQLLLQFPLAANRGW